MACTAPLPKQGVQDLIEESCSECLVKAPSQVDQEALRGKLSLLSSSVADALGARCQFPSAPTPAAQASSSRKRKELPLEPVDRNLAAAVEAAEAELQDLTKECMRYRASAASTAANAAASSSVIGGVDVVEEEEDEEDVSNDASTAAGGGLKKELVSAKTLKAMENTLRKVDRAATKLAAGLPATVTRANEAVTAVTDHIQSEPSAVDKAIASSSSSSSSSSSEMVDDAVGALPGTHSAAGAVVAEEHQSEGKDILGRSRLLATVLQTGKKKARR